MVTSGKVFPGVAAALVFLGSCDTATAQKYAGLNAFEGKDGAYPQSGLIFDAKGNLYGTTAEGGQHTGDSIVFKLAPNGKETALHSFKGGATDGSHP